MGQGRAHNSKCKPLLCLLVDPRKQPQVNASLVPHTRFVPACGEGYGFSAATQPGSREAAKRDARLKVASTYAVDLEVRTQGASPVNHCRAR